MSRLTADEQEKVLMEEYELGWADRAERVILVIILLHIFKSVFG